VTVARSYVLRSIAPALVQAVILLLCFGSGLLLDHFALPVPTIVILTLVLGLTLGRSQRHHGTRQRLVGLAALPLVAVACAGIGWLFLWHATIADTLFTLGLSLSIWLRRFGPWGLQIGALIATPFTAVLVTPVPVPLHPGGGGQPLGKMMLWSAAASVIAFLWVWIVQETATRAVLLPPPAAVRRALSASGGRIQASDRMAVQMALSLSLAFVIGRGVFGVHWTWIVLTAFIVDIGNRGRGDVVHKSVLRIVGASVGTVAATLLSGLFPPHDSAAVAVILVVMVIGNWLRTFSYTYWAGAVTSMLSLLQGYFGENDASLIGERLLQIALGGALSVAVAWFVMPIKSGQMLRRRITDCLAPLTDALVAALRSPEDIAGHQRLFEHALAALEQVAPAFLAHRRLLRVWLRTAAFTHLADAIEAVRGCAEPLSVLAVQGERNPQAFAEPTVKGLAKAVVGNVAGARRYIGRRPEAEYKKPAGAPGDGAVIAALWQIDDHMRVLCDLDWSSGRLSGHLRTHAHRGQDAPGGDPGEAGPGHVQQDQPGGQTGEVLRVADGGLRGEHEEQVAGSAHDG
jgi:hypothetical protein